MKIFWRFPEELVKYMEYSLQNFFIIFYYNFPKNIKRGKDEYK